jgi:hypothetical protein
LVKLSIETYKTKYWGAIYPKIEHVSVSIPRKYRLNRMIAV